MFYLSISVSSKLSEQIHFYISTNITSYAFSLSSKSWFRKASSYARKIIFSATFLDYRHQNSRFFFFWEISFWKAKLDLLICDCKDNGFLVALCPINPRLYVSSFVFLRKGFLKAYYLYNFQVFIWFFWRKLRLK